MGAVNSTGNKLERALAADLPEDERYFGLENFGNTCYCNSVLQALYFCEPFRRAVLDYDRARRPARPGGASDRSDTRASFLSSTASAGSAVNGGLKNAVKGVVGMGGSAATAAAASSSSGGSGGAAAAAGGAASGGGSSSSAASASNGGAASGSVLDAGAEAPRALGGGGGGSGEETMLTALADLFHFISTHKKRTGSVPPKSFVSKLRQQNELFSTYMHQDAHEFLNFILNDIVECLRKEAQAAAHAQRRRRSALAADADPARPAAAASAGSRREHANGHANGGSAGSSSGSSAGVADGGPRGGAGAVGGGGGGAGADARRRESPASTFVHDLFEGKLSNEVRCLCCETVTQRVESFFDLSVDVEQNSSLTACLRNFSSTELLREQDKFYCDSCCSLQEAERRMRVKILPQILSLHLKRFKFIEQFKKYKKLSYRVVFPLELRLCNTSDDAEDPDRLYSLFAVVVHVGSGPNQGHYVSLIKSHGQWLMFDDDCVEVKAESELQTVFGMTQDSAQSTEAGYILFYEQISSNT